MKKATIIGPYRYHNFGDDLIGAIIAKYLQSLNYQTTIPILSKENSEFLGLEIQSSRKRAIKDSDLIVIGGGGILGDSGIKPDDHYRVLGLKAAVFSHFLGKRVVTTGVGAGPLKRYKSKILARLIALLSENVGVRDFESSQFLIETGVKRSKVVQGADIAFLCGDYFSFNETTSNKIGVQFDIENFGDIKVNKDLNNISKEIVKYAISNKSDTILVSNGSYKSQLYQKTNHSCDTLCYLSLQSFLESLSKLKAIFTSHLHLAITAYSLKIPCFSLYVREKTKRFYNQIGRPERAVDIKNAKVGDFERLIYKAENAVWTNDDEERLKLLKKEANKLLKILD